MPLNENVKINLSVDELLSIYHYVPKILLKLAKKVSVTEESFAYSNKSSITFTEVRNGNYLVIATEDVNKSWLLPRVKLRINEFEYQTVQSLFDCRGYQLGAVNKFIAKKPAIVSLAINGQDWKLEQKGILEFGLASALSQESIELEQVEEENQELRSELSELDSQLTKIKEEKEQILSRFNQSEEERKQLLSNLGILAKTHKEGFSQYSLAVTCICLLTGKKATELYDNENKSWNWKNYALTSDRLANILDRMLIDEPNQRFQSASDVQHQLQPSPTPPVQKPEDPISQLLELLYKAAFTGFEGGLLVIAIASLLGTSLISAGFWIGMLILAGLIFVQDTEIITHKNRLVIALITLTAVIIIPALQSTMPISSSLSKGLYVFLLAALSGLLGVAFISFYKLIYKVIKYFFSNK
jgi:TolA-binding protein